MNFRLVRMGILKSCTDKRRERDILVHTIESQWNCMGDAVSDFNWLSRTVHPYQGVAFITCDKAVGQERATESSGALGSGWQSILRLPQVCMGQWEQLCHRVSWSLSQSKDVSYLTNMLEYLHVLTINVVRYN